MNNSIPYLEGHLLQTGGTPAPRSKPAQPVVAQAAKTVFGTFMPYVLLLSVCAGVIGVGATLLPFSREQVAMEAAGWIAFIGTAIVSIYEAVDYERKNAPPEPETEQPKTPGQTIVIRDNTQTGYREREVKIENPPSRAFIVAVWSSRAVGVGNRIPGERFFEDQFKDKADGWLSIMETLGMIEKIWEYETSPRRWCARVGVNQALAMLSYEPIEEPPQQPPQPEKVRAQSPATPKMAGK